MDRSLHLQVTCRQFRGLSARGASKPSSVEVTAMPRLLMATPDSCPLARGTGLDVRDNNILSNYAVL